MGQRLRMFGAIVLIGFIGFLLGVVAKFIYAEISPILAETFPQILSITWMIWGLGGAFLSVVCCLLYAYLT